MPEISIDEAVRRNCQALVAGDLAAVLNDLTPEAVAQAVAGSGGATMMPAVIGYEIVSRQEASGEHRFRISFKGSDHDFEAGITWREVDGAWKITAVDLNGF